MEIGKNVDEVFVTYSWDSEEHKEKVYAFTNLLRKKGFNATMDISYAQNETATDFSKMMHKAMTNYKKVIVVLSKGYKIKAENFSNSVGKEYSLIIKDIDENLNKYILVSFEKISSDITPLAFLDRFTIDLTKEHNYNILFSKLMDEKIYPFADVAPNKPLLIKPTIPEFNIIAIPYSPITIENIGFRQENASMFGGLFDSVEFAVMVKLKNNSIEVIKEYCVEVSYPKGLSHTGNFINNGEFNVYTTDFDTKFYPNQERDLFLENIIITKQNVAKVLLSKIKIKVFTSLGESEKEFSLFNFLKTNMGDMDKTLTIDAFLGK